MFPAVGGSVAVRSTQIGELSTFHPTALSGKAVMISQPMKRRKSTEMQQGEKKEKRKVGLYCILKI